MAWEKRGGRLVYYSARRVGGRVVKEYLGSGPGAHAAAGLEELERSERKASREREKLQRQRDEELEAQAHRLDCIVNQLLEAVGLHRPKRGRWRRRRRAGDHRTRNGGR